MLSAPLGFFLFWVRLWVKAVDPPQKLRHNKTKKGPGPYGEIQKEELGSVPCLEQLIRRLEVKGTFYPPLGGASRAFGLPQAAAKRLLRAWPAPTFDHGRPADSSTRQPNWRTPLSQPCGPCVQI